MKFKLPHLLMCFTILFGLYVALADDVGAFQPVYVSWNESFTDVRIVVKNESSDVVADQTFPSVGTVDTRVVYLLGDGKYNQNHTYYAQVRLASTGDMTWLDSYNDTLGYRGRGDLSCEEVDGCVRDAITDGNTNWDNNYGFITSANDNVDTGELDNLCATNGRILCRTGDTWQCCFDEDTDTDTQLSQEEVQDYIAELLGGEQTRISVFYDDASDLWNFSVDDMNYDDTDLWLNATNQDGRIISLEGLNYCSETSGCGYYASLSDLQSAVSNDFHNLGGVDADTIYDDTDLWLNASNQDDRIILLEGAGFITGLTPWTSNIDGATYYLGNITGINVTANEYLNLVNYGANKPVWLRFTDANMDKELGRIGYEADPFYVSVNVGNFTIREGIDKNKTIDMTNRQLYLNNQTYTLDWKTGNLYSNGVRVLNWSGQKLFDNMGTQSMDWNNRLLYNEMGTPILNYTSSSNLTIYGNVTVSAGHVCDDNGCIGDDIILWFNDSYGIYNNKNIVNGKVRIAGEISGMTASNPTYTYPLSVSGYANSNGLGITGSNYSVGSAYLPLEVMGGNRADDAGNYGGGISGIFGTMYSKYDPLSVLGGDKSAGNANYGNGIAGGYDSMYGYLPLQVFGAGDSTDDFKTGKGISGLYSGSGSSSYQPLQVLGGETSTGYGNGNGISGLLNVMNSKYEPLSVMGASASDYSGNKGGGIAGSYGGSSMFNPLEVRGASDSGFYGMGISGLQVYDGSMYYHYLPLEIMGNTYSDPSGYYGRGLSGNLYTGNFEPVMIFGGGDYAGTYNSYAGSGISGLYDGMNGMNPLQVLGGDKPTATSKTGAGISGLYDSNSYAYLPLQVMGSDDYMGSGSGSGIAGTYASSTYSPLQVMGSDSATYYGAGGGISGLYDSSDYIYYPLQVLGRYSSAPSGSGSGITGMYDGTNYNSLEVLGKADSTDYSYSNQYGRGISGAYYSMGYKFNPLEVLGSSVDDYGTLGSGISGTYSQSSYKFAPLEVLGGSSPASNGYSGNGLSGVYDSSYYVFRPLEILGGDSPAHNGYYGRGLTGNYNSMSYKYYPVQVLGGDYSDGAGNVGGGIAGTYDSGNYVYTPLQVYYDIYGYLGGGISGVYNGASYDPLVVTSSLQLNNVAPTGANAGTQLCIDSANQVCPCGSCA